MRAVAEFVVFVCDGGINAVAQPGFRVKASALFSLEQVGIDHAGVDDDAGDTSTPRPPVRVEDVPASIPIIVRLAVHVIGDAELLDADGDMLFELIAPALREVFCMIRRVSGTFTPRGKPMDFFGEWAISRYFTNPI
jgi:hypothetical protein